MKLLILFIVSWILGVCGCVFLKNFGFSMSEMIFIILPISFTLGLFWDKIWHFFGGK